MSTLRSSRTSLTPPSHPRACDATLIVCPLSVLTNWQQQIGTHVRAGECVVHTYHGSTRVKEWEHLKQYDVVLTTYNIVASEFQTANITEQAQQDNEEEESKMKGQD